MNAMYVRYKKEAGAKAKEYLRLKRGYKTREQKKAFRIAEKYRTGEWRRKIEKLEAPERAAQLKAFRYYRLRKNFLLVLIAASAALLALVAALIVLL